MGIFSRIRDAFRSKANAAVDKMIDPEKELDMAILELEEQRKKAIKELLGYKATAKQMQQDMKKYLEKSREWEKKAMTAVKAGDDELARKALAEKKRCKIEAVKIKRDADEASMYAMELNESRKKAETKLKILKLKKGTMATQLAAARSGTNNPFGHDDEVWEKFQRAEDKIDAVAIEAEVDAAMKGEEVDGTPTMGSADLPELMAAASEADADVALAELKKKLADSKAKKKQLTDGNESKPE